MGERERAGDRHVIVRRTVAAEQARNESRLLIARLAAQHRKFRETLKPLAAKRAGVEETIGGVVARLPRADQRDLVTTQGKLARQRRERDLRATLEPVQPREREQDPHAVDVSGFCSITSETR